MPPRHDHPPTRKTAVHRPVIGKLEVASRDKTLTAPPRERRRRRPIRSFQATSDGASSDFSVPCPPPVRRGTPARHRRDLAGRCAMSDQSTSVYRYYDADAVLIYVGITNRGMQRQHEHNIRAEWWPYVTRQEVEHYPNRSEAGKRERELIQRHRPPFNTQHNLDPSAAKAAYLAERERRGAMCPCGPDCRLAREEHMWGWGIGWENASAAYPAMYANFLATLIVRSDDPATSAAAEQFVLAGVALMQQLANNASTPADMDQVEFICEVLPTQADINQRRHEFATQDGAAA